MSWWTSRWMDDMPIIVPFLASVLEEANAVGTAWLRADLLHEPHRSECKRLLREYVDVRLEATRSGDVDQLAAAMQHSTEIHDVLWEHVTRAAQDRRDSVMIGLVVTSFNEVIDLHSQRIGAALRNRIPEAIWSTLYWIACVCTGLLGFLGGTQNQRSLLVGLALMITFSFVQVLIMDLDRPRQHAFSVSQAALEEVAAQMTAAER